MRDVDNVGRLSYKQITAIRLPPMKQIAVK